MYLLSVIRNSPVSDERHFQECKACLHCMIRTSGCSKPEIGAILCSARVQCVVSKMDHKLDSEIDIGRTKGASNS